MDNSRPQGYVKTAEIPLDKIETGGEWWEDKALTAGLAEVGQIDEIIVYQNGTEGWNLVAGRGRCASAKSLGWATIRADVYACETAALAALGLSENVRRANPLGAAEMICQLEKAGADDAYLLTVSGMNSAQRKAALDLLKLPKEMRESIRRGELKPSAAKWLLKLPDTKTRRRALKMAGEINKAKDKPRKRPTIEDIKAAVRSIRSEMQPQMKLDRSSSPVIRGEDVRKSREGQVDPIRLAVVLRGLGDRFEDQESLGAVIAELELM